MNDILPPRRRPGMDVSPTPLSDQQAPSVTDKPIPALTEEKPILAEVPPVSEQDPAPKPKKRLFWRIILAFIAFFAILFLASAIWYAQALQPVSPKDTSKKRVQIVSGSSPSEIARELYKNKLIRSQLAFDIYTRLNSTRAKLQAGTYSISPSESLGSVVNHLSSGKVDQFTLTFYPGATITDTSSTPESKKTDVATVLLNAGYSKNEVDVALKRTYNHPLFAGKPPGTSLEGYVYGETYNFYSSATVEQILTRTFDEYYKQIQKYNLVEGFKKQGLSLYQGVTLASIIQREVSGATDQKQVAQVFLLRLSQNMPLGSDVTYQYAAKQMGVAPTPLLDSPYNTRKVAGLPPGPISVPGLMALQSVANPAPGDYLFFLSGDDGKTYFARTSAEHDSNIKNYCQIKCATN